MVMNWKKNLNINISNKAEVGKNVIFNTQNGGEIIVDGESYSIGNSKIYSNRGKVQ